MRIGIIGRTRPLLLAAEALRADGHSLTFIYTSNAETYYECEPSEFESLASACSVPFFNDLCIEDHVDELQATDTDVCISINWPTLLSVDFLQLFPFGILNGHPGDLPRYRGNACPNWAILNGESSIGMTVHLMSPELDSGPIYLKEHFNLDDNTYIGDFIDWHQTIVPIMYSRIFHELELGAMIPEPQDSNIPALRVFPRKPEDSRINWEQSCRDIHRLIRASSRPFDGCHSTTEDGMIVKIFRATIVTTGYNFSAIPGQVCEMRNNLPLVACGDREEMLQLTDFRIGDLSHTDSVRRLARSMRGRLR